jgi:glycosyltransferase involved in cell wall biosynthesis
VRVLCLDVEGGYGGSSRSLFEAVSRMDPNLIKIDVWCKRAGPIQERYRSAGVAATVMPSMPKMSSLPRLSRNLWQAVLSLRDFATARSFLARLRQAAATVDVIHLNHEGLYLLAHWLRQNVSVPITSHVRTIIVDTAFARWQARMLFANTDARAFITENERAFWHRFAGRATIDPKTDRVIYNPVTIVDGMAPHPSVPQDGRLRVACISNYAWIRGIDRLVETAEVLKARDRQDICFVVAGDMMLRGTLPGELGTLARKGGTLADYASARGVSPWFRFLGHVNNPESVLAACDLLAKPTREDNPWGRDILEAMAAGRAAASVGSYDRFVEDGVTGILMRDFTAEAFADRLQALSGDRGELARLGRAARERVRELCDGPSSAAQLFALWRDAAQRCMTRAS